MKGVHYLNSSFDRYLLPWPWSWVLWWILKVDIQFLQVNSISLLPLRVIENFRSSLSFWLLSFEIAWKSVIFFIRRLNLWKLSLMHTFLQGRNFCWKFPNCPLTSNRTLCLKFVLIVALISRRVVRFSDAFDDVLFIQVPSNDDCSHLSRLF